MTHTATAHSVEYTGAKAVFCDVDKITKYCNNTSEKNSQEQGLIVVHLTGLPCDLNKIRSIVKKQKNFNYRRLCSLPLKRDPSSWQPRVKRLFFFYPTKQITTGEGGAVVTNNKSFIKK